MPADCPACGAHHTHAGGVCPGRGGALREGEAERMQTSVGRVVLGERIAEGRHAEIWTATLPAGDHVVLKRARPRDEEGILRLAREAEVLRACRHPTLLAPLGWAGAEDRPEALVLPRYRSDLSRLRPAELVALDLAVVASSVATALGTLHEAGVLHRDVRAANVLVGGPPGAELVLADLGHASAPGAARITPEGHVVGTHGSIAPECAGGAPATTRSDIYALGVMLFALVAGERPFAHPDLCVELARAASEDPFPLHSYRQALPIAPRLAALVHAAVHRDPSRRPPLEAFIEITA